MNNSLIEISEEQKIDRKSKVIMATLACVLTLLIDIGASLKNCIPGADGDSLA